MSQERLSMRKLKEVLRLSYECKLSNRKIARALKLSATTVGYYLNAAKAAEIKWSAVIGLDEQALFKKLEAFCPQLKPAATTAPIDFIYIHQQLKRKGLTRELLHEEYSRNCQPGNAISYNGFCRKYREFRGKLKPSMRQTHVAGEKIFVDYAGPTVPIYDRESGEINKAVIFVGVLGASSFTYAEATMTRSLPDWTGSHVRMFTYFGGVTDLVIPDNEKSAVNKACKYDPDVNPHYAAMAAHYGTVVIPTRPYRPQDKSKAEIGVQVVERWILARLRHQQFFSLGELNQAIAKWLEILNDKPFQKLPGTRRSVYESMEKPALKPLPDYPYEFVTIKKAQVNLDYHVGIDGHHYSVPHQYINQRIEYHLGGESVSLFYKGKRVAMHARSRSQGKATTLHEHMPQAHRAHQAWTPRTFLLFAESVGEAMTTIAKDVVEKMPNPECCYRIHLGFSNLEKRYGTVRLHRACEYALKHQLQSYSQINSILKTQSDKLPAEPANDTDSGHKPCQHDNLRGAHYYSTTTGDLH